MRKGRSEYNYNTYKKLLKIRLNLKGIIKKGIHGAYRVNCLKAMNWMWGAT